MKYRDTGKIVHGGTGRLLERLRGERILDFSASMNPFPPEFRWEPDKEAIGEYPDDTYGELKAAVGKAFGRPPEEITVGNGSIEIIRTFCAAVLCAGDRCHIPEPTFGEYAFSARMQGALPVQERDRAKVVFICNPNNPTGALHTREELLKELENAESRGGYLFVDEAFIELADPDESLVHTRDSGLFVCRSLTKSFAVPGLRIGFGFGEPALIERMEALRLPWTVNAYAEAFAIRAMEHLEELALSRRCIAAEREWLRARLAALGLHPRPSAANFILVDLPCDAEWLQERLLAHHVLVRDCTSFGLPRAIRIGVRKRDENEHLLEAIERCLP